MKKRVLLILLILILSAITVSALDLTYEATRQKVLPNDHPIYILHLTNNALEARTVSFKTLSYDWKLDQEGEKIVISAKTTEDFEISYTPVLTKTPGIYAISLIAETSEDKIEKFLTVQVLKHTEIINASILNPTINPKKTVILKVNLENTYHLDLDALTFTASTDFFKIEKQINLKANEIEELSFNIDLSDTTKEGDYDLNLVASTPDGTKYLDDTQTLTVSKFSNLKEVITPQTGFLVYGNIIQQTNDGNTVLEKTYKIEISGFSKRFTTFTPVPEYVKINDKYYAQWTYALQPGESTTISYKTNYGSPLIILLIIIILLIAAYVVFNKPIALRKKVVVLHTEEAGQIGIMKVLISIRNKTNLSLTNINLVDRLPKIIRKPTEFGSYQPDSITNMGEGLRISWNNITLRPKQERVISYKIAGSMKYAGDLKMPATIARVRKLARKFRIVSNTATLKER